MSGDPVSKVGTPQAGWGLAKEMGSIDLWRVPRILGVQACRGHRGSGVGVGNLACCLHGESGDPMSGAMSGGSGWREGRGSGLSSKDLGSAPRTRCAVWQARARNPRREQRWSGARMLALTQRREAVVGLGRGLGLREVRMESLRVC